MSNSQAKGLSHAVGLVFTPRAAWQSIAADERSDADLFKQFLVLAALVPAFSVFLGLLIAAESQAQSFFWFSFKLALGIYLQIVLDVIFVTLVARWALPKTGTAESVESAFKLVAFGFTPIYVVSVILIISPSRVIVWQVVGLIWSLYLIAVGLRELVKLPQSQVSRAVGLFAIASFCTVPINRLFIGPLVGSFLKAL